MAGEDSLPFDYDTLKARMALRTARTVTPTSAKTANHMVAMPKAARLLTLGIDASIIALA